ncbi:MAG: metallophosphoesterase [Myxococcota bacterium]
MARTRRLFLSDLHLSSRAASASGRSWWGVPGRKRRLLAYLDGEVLGCAQDLREVVLLGDIFDNWLAPMCAEPPTYAEMLAANQDVLVRLALLLERGVNVVFIPGNHDYDLDVWALEAALPGATVRECFEVPGVLHARHGHEHTMFNSCDLDEVEGRPLGYFFGRMGEELLPGGESTSALIRYFLRGALNNVHRADFVGRVMRVVFETARVTARDVFVMDDGQELRVADVLERYALSAARMPLAERLWRLAEKPKHLGGSARRHVHASGCPIVLLGHTHDAVLKPLRAGNVWLANCGAWCQEVAHVIEVIEHDPGAPVEVTLRRVDEDGVAHDVTWARVGRRRCASAHILH